MYPLISLLTKLSITEASRWSLYIHSPIYTMENCEAPGLGWLAHKNLKSVSNLKT